MHQLVNRFCVYYPIQFVRGEHVWRLLPHLRRLSTLPPEDLAAYQLARLRELAAHCEANVPYYRRLFRQQGLRASQLRALSDLRRLPILEKAHIREHEAEMLDRSQRMTLRGTSGSSGQPLVFHKDKTATAYMEAAMYAFYAWHGVGIGAKQARFWGRALGQRGRLLQAAKDSLLNRIRLSAFNLSEASCLAFYNDIKRFKPDFVYAYPNAAYRFALFVRERGLAGFAAGNFKAVICTGEVLLPEHREAIQAVFNCPVVNEYGSTENGVIAFECPAGRMHLAAHNLLVEFLRDGQPVAEGETGEIVVTELHSRSIPFLRYRIGDVGRPLGRERCACGITLPLIDKVEGRVGGFIRRPDGGLVYGGVLAYLLKGKVRQFQGVQTDPRTLLVKLVARNGSRGEWEAELRRDLAEHLGNQMNVRLEFVDDIPVERTGKLRYFIPLDN